MKMMMYLAIIVILMLEIGVGAHNNNSSGEVRCIERERQALLEFKNGLVDNNGMLSSWTINQHDCCLWKRVHCRKQTGHVLMLDLHGDIYADPPTFLQGNISSSLMVLQNLVYLNLAGNRLQGSIPYQLGNLSHLQHLDLRGNHLVGEIPYQLGNLSYLKQLHLGGDNVASTLKIDQHTNGGWLSSLISLTHLTLSQIVGLNSYSHSCLQMIAKLPNLKVLHLPFNNLSDHNILSLNSPLKLNFSHSLSVIDLSRNNFTSSILLFQCLSNSTPHLVDVDLSSNLLEGLIPNEFSRVMNSLQSLNLFSNKLKGGFKSLGNICTLNSLKLSKNQLSGDLATFLPDFSGCTKYSFQELDLGYNQINGTISKDLQFPPTLGYFYIPFNSLEGVLTDSHFANMSNLKTLDLSYNPMLALRFNHDWIPPFQLKAIYLSSCRVGPDFPKWLKTQKSFIELHLSNASISGVIPDWFWALLGPNHASMDISSNNIWGTLPNLPLRFVNSPVIFLGSNNLEGPIPQFLSNASCLDLSRNKFSELHLFLCANTEKKSLQSLDLSHNNLSGQLADCWGSFKSLAYLDLSNNNFSGSIPASIGSLHKLQALIMRNNSFTMELPFSLKSCSNLVLLDVGENRLTGPIPSWIGMGFLNLKILSLRKNHFSGSLPFQICYVESMRFLDFSFNNLSGQLLKCFNNFTTMSDPENSHGEIIEDYIYTRTRNGGYAHYLIEKMIWKGVERNVKNTKLLLKGIDLSSNELIGEIPPELCTLVGLISLNLSRNHLTGEIPSNIGQLSSLDSLDLSRNHLIGSIPSSLAQIYGLSMLDLSHNNLSGRIPIGTQLQSFNSSSYEENLDLCGKPLENLCPNNEDERPQEVQLEVQEDRDLLVSKGFYWSMALGFVVGFCGIFGSILFNHSWRNLYFMFLNNLVDTIYVMIIVNTNICKRWFHAYLEKLT